MKKLLFLFCFLPLRAFAFQQTLFPGTMANLAVVAGQNSWNNPNNAKTEDSVVTSTLAAGTFGTTVLLEASNFGFTLPNYVTVKGIKVEVKENENTQIIDGSAVLFDINGSSVGSVDHATPNPWPTPLTYVTYGSQTDLWGFTNVTPDFINSQNFGFGISATKNSTGLQTAEIDAIRITVYFSQPTTIYNGTIFKATLR